MRGNGFFLFRCVLLALLVGQLTVAVYYLSNFMNYVIRWIFKFDEVIIVFIIILWTKKSFRMRWYLKILLDLHFLKKSFQRIISIQHFMLYNSLFSWSMQWQTRLLFLVKSSTSMKSELSLLGKSLVNLEIQFKLYTI